jgi:two-component system, chemotaxis family, protein-glutamate methylesterase/glutaminase
MHEPRYIVVVGASAGGMPAISELVSGLQQGLDVAVFIALHTSRSTTVEILLNMLRKQTRLTCDIAQDEAAIESGHVYLAPADRHLMVMKGRMLVTTGPHENRWRPSIDVLFRSAAAAYNSRVIGIVLSGLLDDGTSGMGAIKKSGGLCIVQEPAEAEFGEMPGNVVNKVEVDYRVPVRDIPYILQDLATKPMPKQCIPPPEVVLEAEITAKMRSSMEDVRKIGEVSDYVCPDCGGSLVNVKDDAVERYRCHTGHVYTKKVLLEKQSENIEDSLWVAIRLMEERYNLLKSISGKEEAGSYVITGVKEADELKEHAQKLKSVLLSLKNGSEKK